jgi:chaperonin GroES
MSVPIKPLADYVVAVQEEAVSKTASGLYLPETAKEKPQEGKVVAVGKGKMSDEGTVLPMQVKVGDVVLYGKYSGTEIKLDDQDHLILHQDDILGIVTK